MIFSSYSFIFAFLPMVLVGCWFCAQGLKRPGRAIWWLIATSVVFYAIWNPLNLLIIGPSLAVNYLLARWLESLVAAGPSKSRTATRVLIAGLTFNLLFLGYFKYKNFFLESINWATGSQFELLAFVLPLGISFITFQKIAFLIDVRSGGIRGFSLSDFLIFVVFFPQLIAGPIVHYREMVPQFKGFTGRLDPVNVAIGAALFAMGLFKKVVLADGIAPYGSSVFAAAERGESLGLINAWMGAAAFTLQVYFDFSGYSDMATGLARMFGVRLPQNFDSPLKAPSIIEFWNRWHMTLTRFLTAYVYTPLHLALTRRRMQRGQSLVGRRQSPWGAFAVLVAMPTMTTMFLSGLWHGAGVTFILYGTLHGIYLVTNHAWRQYRPAWDKVRYDRVMRPLGIALTLAAAVFSMSLFKSATLQGAWTMVSAMLGSGGVSMPSGVIESANQHLPFALQQLGIRPDNGSGTEFAARLLWVLALGLIALSLPNSMQIMSRFEPVLGSKKLWAGLGPVGAATLSPRWALLFGAAMALGLLGLNRTVEFLYWQF